MSESQFKVLICIMIVGLLTIVGISTSQQFKANRNAKITSNCKYLKSYEYPVLNHRHGRTGIADEYLCPDGSTEKVYR